MKSVRRAVYNIMTSTETGKFLVRKIINNSFRGSAVYWEKRYRNNGNSGKGSYGANAEYKAAFINNFVAENNIQKVIEFGCGDGNQLKHFHFPSYIGLDVSPTAIKKCSDIFKEDTTKSFFLYNQKTLADNVNIFLSDLSLSLDVIFHLVEDKVFEIYMVHLFEASSKYVIIYAWDVEEEKKYHVRHRCFTKWIEKNIPGFELTETIKSSPKDSFCDFFIYKKVNCQLV